MKKIALLALIFSTILVTNCKHTKEKNKKEIEKIEEVKQPSCSEEMTKNTVKELFNEIILRDVAFKGFLNDYVYPNGGYLIENIAKMKGISIDNVLEIMKKEIQNEIRINGKDSTIYTQHIANAQKKIEKLSYNLVNIRIMNKQNELKKCTCEANLQLNNGNTVELLYTVQLNENDETFVELQIIE